MEIRGYAFQALADPSRRANISSIALQAITPTAILVNIKLSRQIISRHLQIMTECKILTQVQNGREIYNKLPPIKMKELEDFIEPFCS
ncbi:MAG: winged helix-turn-helix transcriptional regulator [Saprospiraceae bacterium]|nr:winged helix-turn-helix transcriptional regulator [Candidatus Brachybacter algidus]